MSGNGNGAWPGDQADDLSASSIEEGLNQNAETGERLTPIQRARRDVQIINLLRRGITVERVAAQFALTTRAVRYIRQKYRDEQPDLSELDPTEVVRETLDGYEAAIEELALIAAGAEHDATKVGAIRTRLEAIRGRIEMLQSVGAVPHDLGQIRVIEDVRESARQVIQVFREFNVPEDVQAAVIDALEGRRPALPSGGEVVDGSVDDG